MCLGLELYTYTSIQDDELIVMIRAPVSTSESEPNVIEMNRWLLWIMSQLQESIITSFANKIEFKMLLDKSEARRRMEAGGEEVNEWGIQKIQAVKINEAIE